ncbi:MAG: AbrB/MazE/SpoVT family DNA-binding domain-containing protein [Acidobacteriota bacterium]
MKRHSRMRYFGSATVGERGQMVIPAEARRALDINDGEKIVVFGRGKGRLTLVKADMVSEFVSRALTDLTELERQLRSESEIAEEAAETP